MITQPLLGRAVQGLNDISSAAGDLKLGTLLVSMVTAHNQLQVDHNALQAKYAALLTHLDVANVAALGTAHAATYGTGVSAATAPTVGSL
jgi:hypothetical protein